MGSENVELVRSIMAEWGRGDFSSAGWADPEIEYVHADGPSPGTWRGLAGMEEGWRDALRAWTGLRVETDEYRELKDDRVLVLAHLSGHGKTSGLDLARMQTRGVGLFQVRDGKVTRLVWYWDRERGFAELGLNPERPSGLVAGWLGRGRPGECDRPVASNASTGSR
jgi:ketosteroid isomerase-like protein